MRRPPLLYKMLTDNIWEEYEVQSKMKQSPIYAQCMLDINQTSVKHKIVIITLPKYNLQNIQPIW